MKDLLTASLAILAIAVSAFAIVRSTGVVEPLGSGAGQDYYTTQYFSGGLVEGGITSTSTTGTVVIPFTAFDEEKVVAVLPLGATTLTLPASSTMAGIIPVPGMSKTFLVHNRGTSTNAITIAGNTGTLLKRATTSSALTSDSDGGNFAQVTLIRLTNGNISAGFDIKTD